MFDCSGAYEDSETNIYLFIIFTKESPKHIEYEKAFSQSAYSLRHNGNIYLLLLMRYISYPTFLI